MSHEPNKTPSFYPSIEKVHSDIKWKLLSQNPKLQNDVTSLLENGYVIIKNVVPPKEVSVLLEETDQLLKTTKYGTDPYEGVLTKRVYATVSRTRKFDKTILNKRVGNILKYFLLGG